MDESKFPTIVPVSPTPASSEQIQKDREQQKVDLEHQIVISRLDVELAETLSKLQFYKKSGASLNPEQALREDFQRHHGAHTAAHNIAQEAKRAAREKYPEGSDALERELESIRSWENRHL